MTALLLLALSVVFSVLAGEVHGLRQTVRDRFARTNAELHTIESILAVHREILDGLKSDMAAMVEEDQRTSESLCKLWAAVCNFENKQEKIAESGVIAGERESVLSKAMEEGIMNLMGYAAGKVGTGIEVGLG